MGNCRSLLHPPNSSGVEGQDEKRAGSSSSIGHKLKLPHQQKIDDTKLTSTTSPQQQHRPKESPSSFSVEFSNERSRRSSRRASIKRARQVSNITEDGAC
jgi:hypothetical protein